MTYEVRGAHVSQVPSMVKARFGKVVVCNLDEVCTHTHTHTHTATQCNALPHAHAHKVQHTCKHTRKHKVVLCNFDAIHVNECDSLVGVSQAT